MEINLSIENLNNILESKKEKHWIEEHFSSILNSGLNFIFMLLTLGISLWVGNVTLKTSPGKVRKE